MHVELTLAEVNLLIYGIGYWLEHMENENGERIEIKELLKKLGTAKERLHDDANHN